MVSRDSFDDQQGPESGAATAEMQSLPGSAMQQHTVPSDQKQLTNQSPDFDVRCQQILTEKEYPVVFCWFNSFKFESILIA